MNKLRLIKKICYLVKNKLIKIKYFQLLIFYAYLLVGRLLLVMDRFYEGMKIICQIRRAIDISSIKRRCELLIYEFAKIDKASGVNLILESFLKSKECIKIRKQYFSNREEFLRKISVKVKECRDNEKGVIIIGPYTHYFKYFLALVDVKEIFKNYYLVLEPSWTGYHDPVFLMFINNYNEVFVEAPVKEDADFILSLRSNLIPLNIGASHWVDLDTFYPIKDMEKVYDLIYVANWALYKEHRKLFWALRKLEDEGIYLKVALVGFPWEGRTKKDILKEIKEFKLESNCEIFEEIPPREVNLLYNKSKFSILLSKKEGSCRAVAESIAAGTPVLVYKYNKGGAINLINSSTGILFDYYELPCILKDLLKNSYHFDCRRWAERNIGCVNTSRFLNKVIQNVALKKEEPWRRDIMMKANIPDFVLKGTLE